MYYDLTETLEHVVLKKAWVIKLCRKTMFFHHILKLHFWKTALLLKRCIFFFFFTAQPYHMKIGGVGKEKTLLKEKTKYKIQDVGYQNWTLTAETWMLLKLSRAENCNKTRIYMYISAHPLSAASSLEVLTCSLDSDKPRGEMLCSAIRGEIIQKN